MQDATAAVRFRPPQIADASAIWQLVATDGTLDPNSSYAYLLLCSDFAETCIVADVDGEIAGFVTGYVPPTRPSSLFIWQVCVAPRWRRQRIARRMLWHLLDSPRCRSLRYLEATVSPENQASMGLFSRIAEGWNCPLETEPRFLPEHFPDGHEPEPLIRIGPRPDSS